MIVPPYVPLEFTELPEEPKARHEALVDAFGQMLLSLRNQTLERTNELASSSEAREQIGRLFRGVYDDVAKLAPEEKQVAFKLASTSIDVFGRLFLAMLSGTGTDQRLGTLHSICFRLDMEIKSLESDEIVFVETINREGKKFFPEYWGRWLNRFGRE